jgi:hypothetical protein
LAAPKPTGSSEPVMYVSVPLFFIFIDSLRRFPQVFQVHFDSNRDFPSFSHSSPSQPIPMLPLWRETKKIRPGPSPFRLFGEVIPPLCQDDFTSSITILVAILKRHFKLLMMASAAEIELEKLGAEFEHELSLLVDFFEYYTSVLFELPSSKRKTLTQTLETLSIQFKPLLELSEPIQSDLTVHIQVCFSIRLCVLHLFYICNPPSDMGKIMHPLLLQHVIDALQTVSKSAHILCHPLSEHGHSSTFYQLQLQYIQHLFRLQMTFDNETTPGGSIWTILSETTKLLSGESRWSLVLLSSAINTNMLIKMDSLLYYPGWEVVQELTSGELLKTPNSARNSPTKDPTGPARGMKDLLPRIKYFLDIWPSPPAELLTLLGRFFSERFWRLHSSLDYYDHVNALYSSSNVFDAYLYMIVSSVYGSSKMEEKKIKIFISKSIELFLNVLDDLSSLGLEANTEVPLLLRNSFQFAIAVAPFMSDMDIQNVLLERLLAFSFEQLSPLASRIALQGMFKLLAILSGKRPATMKTAKQELQNELEDIYGYLDAESTHVETLETEKSGPPTPYFRNVDDGLVLFAGARKALVERFASPILDCIIPNYIQLASSTHPNTLYANHAVSITTATHLAQAPSKKQKKISDFDESSSPLHNAEKLVITYLKQCKLIFSEHLSLASMDLLMVARIGELLSTASVSMAIRQHLNVLIQSLIVSTRYTTLETEVKAKMELLWNFAQRALQSPSTPVKMLQMLGELQGLLVQVFNQEHHWSWTELISNGLYKRDVTSRSLPLHALRAWLELISILLKHNVYLPLPIPSNAAFAIGAILINAGMEQGTNSGALSHCLGRIHDLRPANGSKMPGSLYILVDIIDTALVELAQKSPPPGILSKMLLKGFLNFRQQNPDQCIDVAAYFPILVQHLDSVVIQNRTEMEQWAVNGVNTKLSTYDDAIYPAIVYCFKTIPHWLHHLIDVRYNVFGKLVTELFIEPIRAMAATNSTTIDQMNQPVLTSHSINPPVTGTHSSTSNTSSLLPGGGAAKTSTGMVFGKTRIMIPPRSSSTSSSSSSSSSSSASAILKARTPSAPTVIKENAIKHLPFVLHAIAQLDFAADGNLQRYVCELLIGVFRSFLSGKEGSHDARLIEQFASGLVAPNLAILSGFGANPTLSNIINDDEVFQSRLRTFRNFFFGNCIPWLKSLIEKDEQDSYDTNCFVLARLLAWIVLKLKHSNSSASSLDVVRSFLMSVHFLLDLFRARKPTTGALAKKEMLGFFSIFCSTFLKIVPAASPMTWLQQTDVYLHDLLLSALTEIVFAIVRDLDYISTATWPNCSAEEAILQTALRHDHINSLFERTVDHTVILSTLSIVDQMGVIDGLKELTKAHCEVIDFVRQLGAVDIITKVQERIKTILYLPPDNVGQRHARADIKGALEVARKDFGRISYLLMSKR